MKILVDHGSSNNLGDIAMLEGAVSHLVNILPEAKIYVLDKPTDSKTRLWGKPNVFKCKPHYIGVPGRFLLDNTPFFWRLDNSWSRLVDSCFLAYLNNYFYGSNSFFKKEPSFIASLSKFCSNFDALFIAGGGNLNYIFLGAFFNKFCLMSVFIKQGKPVILTGQQIGPLKSINLINSAEQLFQRVNFLGIRDPWSSLDFCRRAKVKKEHYCVMGDDSFGLPDVNNGKANKVLESLGLAPGKFFAFNVRFSFYTGEFFFHIKKIADLADRFISYYKMPILFVPIAFNKGDSDIRSSQALIDLMKSKEVKILQYDAPDPVVTREIIGNAFAAIGLSYHFCTFALTKGIPTVSIYDGQYYEHKAIGLYKFWEKNILTCSLKKNSTEQIFDEIKSFLDQRLPKEEALSLAQERINNWNCIFEREIKENMEG